MKNELLEEDARRITACVNACHGLETDDLEATGLISAVGYQLARLRQEHDQLLDQLRQLVSVTTRDAAGHIAPADEIERVNQSARAVLAGAAPVAGLGDPATRVIPLELLQRVTKDEPATTPEQMFIELKAHAGALSELRRMVRGS
ncbi:hypothetical protein EGJ86_23520 [Pseudomonas sp. o96-267]|uniref:hypothetical protein n=1 Tax=Pseudomonas sp. o96-267 TaxID=2479853 RepID=UPI000F7B93B5|nr:MULTISPECIES: hypothetical protein [Pseudomonas]MDH0961054.1 hypothetical protein [Pseudomonas chengduensis]MDV5863688.1 hypothetical protein [Pseudomonas mendocina]RRV28904.1 hypothetical protein EGJ86_23520 [Pseudomonas sp. o96-267]